METAEIIIIGNIYTADKKDSFVESIAIVGDRIIYAGNKAEVLSLADSSTNIINLPADQLVMPGFMDGHCHIGGYSALKDSIYNISEKSAQGSPDMIISEMNNYIVSHPGRNYYVGHNWIDGIFKNNCPTAEILDVLDTDKPVIMIDNGGHSYWVNSAMLKLANITSKTPDPVGGRIERYSDGTPNGCFRDVALALIQKALPMQGPENRLKGLLSGQELYKNYGYTAYFEALTNEQNKSLQYPNIEAYKMLDDDGKIDIYTQGSFVVNCDNTTLELILTGLEVISKTAGGRFEVTTIKLFLDGVVEGKTAHLSNPYECDSNNYGSDRWLGEDAKEHLSQIIEIANFAGVPVHIHAIGDQAVTDALDAFQRVYNKIGQREIDARNAITHLQIVKKEDIKRFKDLGIIAVIDPWAYKAPGVYQTEMRNLGKTRAENEYPYRSFIDAGVMTSFATDWGCSFIADPIECFHVLTTRTNKDDDPKTALNTAECFTRLEAAKIMTYNVAYQMRVEDKMGSLEVGKLANLVILSKDLLSIPNNELMSVKVLAAMSYGKWIKNTNLY